MVDEAQMVSLKNQIRWCVRAQLTLGGLIVVIAAGFYFAGYRPATNRQASLDSDIHSMQRELQENSVKSQILPSVAKEVKSLRLKLTGRTTLPHEMDVAGFVTDIMRISQATQLRKPDYKPEDPKRGDLFSIYPIRLQLQGNFTNIFEFIRETEALPRLSHVRSINIKADGKEPGTVTVNLGMDLYFSPDM
jgi:Tfp pilus assembly protein PilO